MTTTIAPQTINGTITSWIPLTTPGPASLLAECSSAIYYLPGAVSGFVAFDPYYGRWINTTVTCLATQQSQWWQQHSDSSTNDINLAPFACPTGYTTASVSEIDKQTSFVGCCPSSYTFLGSYLGAATLGQCHSPLSVGQTIVGKATVPARGDWEDTTAVVISTGVSVVGVHVNGYIFNNEGSPASVLASTTTVGTTAVASSVVASSTQSTIPTGSSSNSGLSNAAKIGIGVGVALAIIIIVALIAALVLMKRKIRAQQQRGYQSDSLGLASSPAIYQQTNAGTTINEAPGSMAEVSWDNKGPVEMWVPPTYGG